jgi:hypothetical protein
MWYRRSGLLEPLACLITDKIKIEWHSSHQQAFDKIKNVIRTEILLCYTGFNKPFHLYADASDHQLVAVIMQNRKTVDFIRESSIQLKSGIQLLKENKNCYQLLKHAKSKRIFS